MNELINEYIGKFLELNGFRKIDSGTWTNTLCGVRILDGGYEVSSENGNFYSENHNIYWLIGLLTYMGLMKKDYRNP